MKQHTFELTTNEKRFLRTLLWCGIGLIAIGPFHGFLSTWLGTVIGPLWLWKSAKDIVVLLLAVVLGIWLLLDAARRRYVFSLTLVRLLLIYIGVGVLVSIWQFHGFSEALLAGLVFTFRYILLFGTLYVVQSLLADNSWHQWMKRYVMIAAVWLAVVGVIQVTVIPADFLTKFGYGPSTIAPVSTIDANPDARRAFATMRGPNDYGAFLMTLLVACLLFVRRATYRHILTGIILVGLYISSSRSAWLGAAVAVGYLLWQSLRRRGFSASRLLMFTSAAIATGAVLLYVAITIPALRLAVFHSSPGDSHLTEGSTDIHWQQTAAGIARVADNPLGCGIGCAGPATFYSDHTRISENYFVQIAEEVGIIGLILWLGIFVAVMRRLYEHRVDHWALWLFVSGLGLSVIGFWLHVWVDDAVSLLWWGLAGLILGQYASQNSQKALSLLRRYGKTKKQKSTKAVY